MQQAHFPLEAHPLEELQPLSTVCWGVQCQDMVISADSWNPSYGQRLDGDAYFRIVLLRRLQHISTASIKNARLGLCMPQSREVEQVLRSFRDAKPNYVAGTQALGDSMEKRGEKLHRDQLEEAQPHIRHLPSQANVLDDELVDFLRHLLQQK